MDSYRKQDRLVKVMQKTIETKDTLLSICEEQLIYCRDSVQGINDSIIDSYKMDIANLKNAISLCDTQKDLYKQDVDYYKLKYRRQRRWTIATGVGAAILGGILIIK